MPLFSRSFRTLIQRQRGEPRHIKVLQTLGCCALQAAIDIKVLQTLGMARETLSHARVACEGPRPTVNGDDFLFLTVARGPVPRDLSPAAENVRNPETTDVSCSDRCMARDRPSPYGERAIKHGEDRFSHRPPGRGGVFSP